MQQYQQLLRLVLEQGTFKPDRTGTGTYAVFGAQARYPLADGFPMVTTKKLHLKSIIYELLWFLKGDTNIKYLTDHGVSIWNEWADAQGNLGRVYGAQWSDWRTADGRSINQIDKVIQQIRTKPDSRRHIVTAWNPGEVDDMALLRLLALSGEGLALVSKIVVERDLAAHEIKFAQRVPGLVERYFALTVRKRFEDAWIGEVVSAFRARLKELAAR